MGNPISSPLLSISVATLTPAECLLIQHIRALEFGGLEIQVQNGRPVFIEKKWEKIKLS